MALKLRQSDPYSAGTVENYSDGTKELVRTPLAYAPTVYDDYHEVKEGDTLDGIAFNSYVSFTEDAAKYYWVIMDVNNIDNPFDLTPYIGQRLLIPNFTRLQLVR